MRVKRSNAEIIGDILEVLDRGYNKTSSLMKNANLSFTLTKKYINMMISNGLIEEVDGEYKITEKGRRLLENLRRIRSLETELVTLLNSINEDLVNG